MQIFVFKRIHLHICKQMSHSTYLPPRKGVSNIKHPPSSPIQAMCSFFRHQKQPVNEQRITEPYTDDDDAGNDNYDDDTNYQKTYKIITFQSKKYQFKLFKPSTELFRKTNFF